MTLLMSYEDNGDIYETSTALTYDSIKAIIETPAVLNAKLAETDNRLFAILVFQEGVGVLDVSEVLSPPSFWSEEAMLSLFASCFVITLLVRRLPYMRNGHHRPLGN